MPIRVAVKLGTTDEIRPIYDGQNTLSLHPPAYSNDIR